MTTVRPRRVAQFAALAFASTSLAFAVALTAAPTALAAGMTVSPAPGATVTTSTVTLTATATDTVALRRWAQLSVDGTYQSPALSLSPDLKTLTLTLTWPRTLTDGLHAARLFVSTEAGVTSRRDWTFTVAAPPVVSAMLPAAGGQSDSTTPAISAKIVDNGSGVASATMSVDGTAVASAFSPSTGLITYTPVTPLSNATTHTVTVVSRDGKGNQSTTSWSFVTHLAAPMKAVICTTCHVTYPGAHPFQTITCLACHTRTNTLHDYDPACTGCHTSHSATYLAQRTCTSCHAEKADGAHGAKSTPAHTTSYAGFDACKGCHDPALHREHARYKDKSGVAMTCESCHGAAAATAVKSAVSTHNTSCSACHNGGSGSSGGDPHASLHGARDLTPGCIGSNCHTSATVSLEHQAYLSRYPAYATTCALCHQNTTPGRVDWSDPGNRNADCARCHTLHRDPAIAHQSKDSAGCSCHVTSTNVAIQHGNQCSLCHGPTAHYKPTNGANCDSCHPPGH